MSPNEFSTEGEWTQLLKRVKYQSKAHLAVKILNLKERRWNKENILLSDVNKIYLKINHRLSEIIETT